MPIISVNGTVDCGTYTRTGSYECYDTATGEYYGSCILKYGGSVAYC